MADAAASLAAFRDRRLLLAVPVLAWLLVFYAYPLGAMLLQSMHGPTPGKVWSLAVFGGVLESDVFWRVMWITASVSLIVTAFCLLLGYPVAYVMARASRDRANLLMLLVLVPFWTSILVRTYAWTVLLGRNGIINNLLLFVGAIDRPLRLLNTRFAVIVAMVHVLLPFMILPIYAALRGLDWRLMQAASGLGAGPLAAARQVLLPLSLRGISAGCVLVFTLSIGFYITPALVGGTGDVMISMLISDQVGLLNWPSASAMAAVLLAVVLVAFVVFTRVTRVDRLV